ncbi:MAG TPA: sensor histidine kinase [Mycobacteriales bacterium]|nr:sensor histidine kinase [Mycobacteriales bacterium]
MKKNARDRTILATAVALVIATSGLVVGTVLQAKRDGTKALESLQVAQVEQLTKSMDARVKGTLDSFGGFVSGPQAWNATLRDASDKKRLDQLQALNSKARTGILIVDASGVVTNGTLLRDPSQIGRRLDREGLDVILADKPGLTPVGQSATTALPSMVIGYPLRDKTGAVIGAFLFESDVSADSAFSAEVAGLRRGRTGEFSFIDSKGVVVASSNQALLGKPIDEPLLDRGASGFQRSGDRVVVAQAVPSAGWRTVFRQDAAEFEGALTGPLESALLLVLVAGAIAAVVSFVLLGRRLRRARDEQRRLEEVSAVREEFISIVSHELRTPVAGLLGFLQTTLDHWEAMTDDERQRAIGRSLSSARRLHSLTRDVLDSSTIEAGELIYTYDVVDLRSEVSSAVLALNDLLPERRVTLTVADDPIPVSLDPERIQQVLTNLLDNAVRSGPGLTPVDVVVEARGDVARVEVRDHGPGLSPNELGRVFEKFVRGRTSTVSGTGLGLYISRQIVEAHGGTIYAETRGDGATFSFDLPLAPATATRTVT